MSHATASAGCGTRLLDWYASKMATHPYTTGVITATTAYVGGDALAKLIAGTAHAALDPVQCAVLTVASAYYGWETPAVYAAIDREIPATGFVSRLRRAVWRSCGFGPFWTVRHMALLEIVHGTGGSPLELVARGLAVWGSSAVTCLGIDYVVQSRVPLPLRFLTQAAVTLAWQLGASLWTCL